MNNDRNPGEIARVDAATTAEEQRSTLDKILQMCDELTLHELCRLESKIIQMSDDPERIRRVKQQLDVGDEVEFFEQEKNRLTKAVFLQHNRKLAVVQSLEDGKRWRIPYALIKTKDVPSSIDAMRTTPSGNGKPTRDNFSVGDIVGFRDRNGQEWAGTIVRLNSKTATIESDESGKWRVSYGLLYPILEAEAGHTAPPRPKLSRPKPGLPKPDWLLDE